MSDLLFGAPDVRRWIRLAWLSLLYAGEGFNAGSDVLGERSRFGFWLVVMTTKQNLAFLALKTAVEIRRKTALVFLKRKYTHQLELSLGVANLDVVRTAEKFINSIERPQN